LSRRYFSRRIRLDVSFRHQLHVLVELVHQRGDRQARADLVGGFEADPEVLAHPVHGETEVELVRQHGLVAVDHLPRPGCALRDDLDHLLAVEAGFLAKGQCLGQALHEARDADLVHHLGQLPCPAVANPAADAGIGGHDWFGPGIVLFRAAAHDGELAVLGPGLSAGHRRVDEMKVERLRFGGKLAGDMGGDGGVIDEDRALGHAREGPVRASADLGEVVVVADAGHDEVGPRRGLARGRSRAALVFRGPGFGLGGGAVVDRHLMSLGRQMPGHREAHDSQAKKCHFRHLRPLHVALHRRFD
jgi:hypothetical protein